MNIILFSIQLFVLLLVTFFTGYIASRWSVTRRIRKIIFKHTDEYQDQIETLMREKPNDDRLSIEKCMWIVEGRLQVTNEVIDCLKKV